jgi:hypothetical protein
VSATGVQGHYGSVAFSAASRGSNMYNICDASSVGTCKDIASDATTGLVSSTQGVGTIATCGTGGNQCYVEKAYDDSGAGHDMASLGAARPAFQTSAIGSLPGVGCVNDGSTRLGYVGYTTTASAMYWAMVFHSNGTPPAVTTPIFEPSGGDYIGINFSPGQVFLSRNSSGSAITFTVVGGTNYAFIAGDDGATASHFFIDGTDNTGTSGTNTSSGTKEYCNGGGAGFIGFSTEIAFYNADLASVASSMNTTIHTNNGF